MTTGHNLFSALRAAFPADLDGTAVETSAPDGSVLRYSWRDLDHASARIANLLAALKLPEGSRVAAQVEKSVEALLLYLATLRAGHVFLPLNTAYRSAEIAYFIDNAEPAVVVCTPGNFSWVSKIAFTRGTQHVFTLADDRSGSLLERASAHGAQHQPVPRQADDLAAIVYTSGTTGNPKAALYSHRSTTLHAYAAALPDVMCLSARDSVLPVVPMFHVNAWGIPYSAALMGCKLVFPGPAMDGKSIYELIEAEQVNYAAGVPTVWQMMLGHMKPAGLRFSTLQRTVIGGSACPPAMIHTFKEDYGVEVLHAWGMTEMSPLGTLCTLKSKHLAYPKDEQMKLLQKQGRAIYGVDMKIVDGDGKELPWDGKTYGDLLVRGPWIVNGYFKGEGGDPLIEDEQGRRWFPTGDVATIDADGFMQITDRSKDVIKSGGEWISSIAIENLAMAHPAVAMAACVGMPHPKWDERPIVAVVKRPGAQLTREEMLAFYEGKVAKWQIPDDVVFVEAIPLGATGKMLKTKLREQLKGYQLPSL
ncbi:AMP-binding protein [Verminephrobacter sp. Larva24]|nr:AMP-binding protein [Verminephrobacter sp. Larva24]